MKRLCISCGKPISGKKYCNKCYGLSKVGTSPWNKGLTAATDPRVQRNVQATSQALKKMVAEGKWKPWIIGKTKETEPVLKRVSEKNRERTKQQYIKKGKEKWLAERPGFIRTGKHNSDKQKQAARSAMLRSLYTNKIKHKQSKNEIIVKQLLKNAGFTIQEVMIEGVCFPDCFIPELNTFFFYDGSYFHALQGRQTKDKLQTTQLLNMGFNVLRMDEEQFLSLAGDEKQLIHFIKTNLQKSENQSVEEKI